MARNNLNLDLNINELFRKFGMERFVGAVMWIMQEVFWLERECLLCEPDEKEGRYILGEVMAGGNFGHHDERIRKVGRGKWFEVFAKFNTQCTCLEDTRRRQCGCLYGWCITLFGKTYK